MNTNVVEIAIEVCRDKVTLPEYKNSGDAGMDVCAAEDIKVEPGATVIVPTGLKFAIPLGYEIQVRPRSGISVNTPLRVTNSPGTIDSGYRGELGIIITNSSDSGYFKEFTVGTKGNKKGTYIIEKGDRIAQIVLMEVPIIKFKQVKSVLELGQSRGGGFGSTGVNSSMN